MPVFAVQYSYTDDLAAREAQRPEYRAYLGGLADRGVVLASGPFAEGEPDGALIVVVADTKADVVDVVEADPFQRAGVVAGYAFTQWSPIIGRWADDLG
jgi:uncharacterized protein